MPEKTVDGYIEALPAAQRDIVQSLRRLVLTAAPKAKESIKWAQPVYEDNGPFAYIKAFRSYVNFGFWRGVEIDGGRGILETSGSKMAHIRLTSADQIRTRILRGFVREAVKLNRSKGDPTQTR